MTFSEIVIRDAGKSEASLIEIMKILAYSYGGLGAYFSGIMFDKYGRKVIIFILIYLLLVVTFILGPTYYTAEYTFCLFS